LSHDETTVLEGLDGRRCCCSPSCDFGIQGLPESQSDSLDLLTSAGSLGVEEVGELVVIVSDEGGEEREETDGEFEPESEKVGVVGSEGDGGDEGGVGKRRRVGTVVPVGRPRSSSTRLDGLERSLPRIGVVRSRWHRRRLLLLLRWLDPLPDHPVERYVSLHLSSSSRGGREDDEIAVHPGHPSVPFPRL